ncbi:hypothetical protein [Streptomyces bauhiniae]|uniref:Uncharacterized protein n=1 Tax=Streptomyces bauhiniae TaxID=2340725 RepID=A0A7K3QRA2_9ACTN|nr:hypothetical protein [Streptomyces bauhiniae]NEB92431.1 hypothetical protein [Streptomyces bauhiniae]
MIVLNGSTQRETVGAGIRQGTRTPPLPGREDVLNLLGPAPWAYRLVDPYGEAHADQHGPIPVIGILHAWVRLVCEERRWNPPQPTIEANALWLADERRHQWIVRQPWVGDYHSELDALIRMVRATTRVSPRRRPVPQPCPRCDALLLTEVDHELYVGCGGCEARFTREELALGARLTWALLNAA